MYPFEQKDLIRYLKDTLDLPTFAQRAGFSTSYWNQELPVPVYQHIREYNQKEGVKNIAQIAESLPFNNLSINITERKITLIKTEDLYKIPIHLWSDSYNLWSFLARVGQDTDFHDAFNQTKNKLKTEMKPGKFFQLMFPEATPQDCEAFVQTIAVYVHRFENPDIRIVSDKDIVKFYDHLHYISGNGSLQASCMRHPSLAPAINFYTEVNAEMVVLFDPEDETKIRARAILWRDVHIKNDKGGPSPFDVEATTFMDRIYSTKEADLHMMISFAKKNGFIYRKRQSASDREHLIGPVDGRYELHYTYLTYETGMDETWLGMNPYLDTLCFTPEDYSILSSNDLSEGYILRDTDGGRSTI